MAYITLRGKEKLHCARCDTDVGNGRMFLDIDGHTVYECLCETCDRIEHIPEEEKPYQFTVPEYGDLVLDFIDLGRRMERRESNGNRTDAKSAGRT